MNISEFISLLEEPSYVSASQTRGLESILEQYPYFQAARAMQLKGLKAAESFSYNKELKITAAHTVDRSVLFDFITSREFSQNKIANSLKSRDEYLKNITVFEPQEVIVQKSVNIDDAIKMKLKEAQQVFDDNLFEKPKVTKKETVNAEVDIENNSSAEDKLQLGKPLDFDQNESHSFSEWLQLTSLKPIDRNQEEPNSEIKEEDSDEAESVDGDEKTRKLELIDNFIATNPKIQPVKNAPKATSLELSELPKESLMTATLARVYLEQKNYKKAIQAYKILILKYPEKSSFFADQIREIENLIEKQ